MVIYMLKIEFSKFIVILTAIIFIIALLYCMVFYACAMLTDKMMEWSSVVTILSTTGGAFITAIGFYYKKTQKDNNIKLRKHLIEYKYTLLNEIGVLNYDRARQEIEDSFSVAEQELDMIEQNEDQYDPTQNFGGTI